MSKIERLVLCFFSARVRREKITVILIHDHSADKIRGKTASIARKRDAGVLYVRQGVLTRRETWDFHEDVYTKIMNWYKLFCFHFFDQSLL